LKEQTHFEGIASDFKYVVEKNYKKREKEAKKVEKIIENELTLAGFSDLFFYHN
jgi:hypothetical protein